MTDYEVMSYDVVCACAVIYLTCGFLRRGGFVFVSSLGGEIYLSFLLSRSRSARFARMINCLLVWD